MLKQKSLLLLVSAYAVLSLLVSILSPAEYALASNSLVIPGAPLKGVDVKLGRNPGGREAARTVKTDENGKFTIADVPEGTYDLTISLPEERAEASARPKTLAARIVLEGVEGGKMTKDLDFKQEAVPASSKERAARPKFKHIVLRIQVAGNATVSGTLTERTEIMLPNKADVIK